MIPVLDTAGFSDLRQFLQRRISYARYRVGSTWTEATLSGIEILGSGVVRARLHINTGGSAMTVTRVELYNTERQLFASQNCNISVSAGQTGVLFWFDFNITEEVSS